MPSSTLDHGQAERAEHPRHGLRATEEELRQVALEASVQRDSGQQADEAAGSEQQ